MRKNYEHIGLNLLARIYPQDLEVAQVLERKLLQPPRQLVGQGLVGQGTPDVQPDLPGEEKKEYPRGAAHSGGSRSGVARGDRDRGEERRVDLRAYGSPIGEVGDSREGGWEASATRLR